MKKSIFFITLLAMGVNFAFAQQVDSKNDSTRTATDSSKTQPAVLVAEKGSAKKDSLAKPIIFPRAYLGIRGGGNLADMVYSSAAYNRYAHFPQLQPLVGIFGHFHLGKSNFAIRPEVTYIGRADSLNWFDVKYRFKANYIDFRLPITYNIRFRNSHFSPYLMVVPQYNMAIGGKINYRDDIDYPQGVSENITASDIRKFDAAVMAGIGFDYLIETKGMPILMSLEAGYNYGGHNTFAPKEIKDNPSIAPGHYSGITNNFYGAELWEGKRYNRGIEVAMRLALPIDGSWRKPKALLDQVVDTHKCDTVFVYVYDTVYLHDTIISIVHDTIQLSPRINPDTIIRKIHNNDEYVSKDCYTIEEMIQFIYNGTDISDKRMCLSSINFDFDKYDIRQAARPQLNKIVSVMKEHPEISIIIMGHTDSIGSVQYNDRLSLNRANAVARYLRANGIAASRMESKGFGKRYPYTTNENEAGRDMNRRVEIEIKGLGLKVTEQSTEIKEEKKDN